MNIIFDYSKLLGKAKELGLRQKDLAEKAEVSPSTYSQKLNHNSPFTQKRNTSDGKGIAYPYKRNWHVFFYTKSLEKLNNTKERTSYYAEAKIATRIYYTHRSG